jgi:uncharacterized protein (TIGR03663 family)
MKLANTRSTRSSRKKARQRVVGPEEISGRPAASESLVVPERIWRIGVVAILCVGAFLRLYDLNLVPLHHDEGVNGNFLVRLVREGIYHYDPANYHGPTLYYFGAVIPWTLKLLFGAAARETYGLTTVTIRLVPALFGLGTIGLVFLLRRRLGTVATLSAALLLSISPGAVYLSRYFIHETQFVFFTLGIVVASLNFYEERRPADLLLASASAALLFATKETAMISAAVLIIALITERVYLLLYKKSSASGKIKRKKSTESGPGVHELVEKLGGTTQFAIWVASAVVLFLVINVLFYSSFFTNYPKGVYDALQTFNFWTKTGKEAHVHPPLTYLYWLLRQEAPILVLGSLGAAYTVFRPRNSFALFSALWAFGLIAAYSLVPYKTPWLALNFIVPLALIAGYAVQTLFETDMGQLRLPLTVILLAFAVNVYQTVDLNFFNYDNDATYYVYVYAHTKRGTKHLVDEIDKIARDKNEGGKTGITIVSPDYWPLPWYLRNYSRVGYFGKMTSTTEPIIIASESQQAEVESTFGEVYRQIPSNEPGGAFSLRPGVNLLLYVRRDHFGS